MKEKTFYTILGIFVAIISGVFAYAFSCISQLRTEVTAYKDNVQTQITVVNEKLTTVSTDVKWIRNILQQNDIEYIK